MLSVLLFEALLELYGKLFVALLTARSHVDIVEL